MTYDTKQHLYSFKYKCSLKQYFYLSMQFVVVTNYLPHKRMFILSLFHIYKLKSVFIIQDKDKYL